MPAKLFRPIIISTIIFFIPVINSVFHTYSYGIFLLAVAINFTYRILISTKELIILFLIIITIYTQTIITSGLNFKAAVSCIILIYCFFIFYKFGEKLFLQNFESEKIFYLFFFILTIGISFISFSLSFYLNYRIIYEGQKSAFPFEEPSHLALFISPILIVLSSKYLTNIRFVFSFLLLFFSFYFQSLVFFAFCIISIILNLKFHLNIYIKLLIILLIFLVSFILDCIFIDSYLFKRILHVFNVNTINMSALVYQQGWNSIFDSLRNNIFGIGFQFLGNEPANYISQQIYHLSGNFVNRQDGSFLLAKFLSEFGYLGLIVIIFLFRYIFNNIKQYKSIYKCEVKAIYYLFFSLFIPLLFRDVGYFSYTLILFSLGFGFLCALSKKSIFS